MSKKYFLIFSFFFLAGCEVQESKNIYKPPQEPEEFKNIFELAAYSNDQIEHAFCFKLSWTRKNTPPEDF